jgi:hypothetical protein
MTEKAVFRVVFVSIALLLCVGAGSALAAQKPKKS